MTVQQEIVANDVMSWVHFGDLHMTRANEANHRDFQALIAAANRQLAGRVSFAVLPGDNAENGTAEQFQLVRDAVGALSIPLHILAGDHDFHSRSLDAFHRVLGATPMPKAVTVAGCRCLFLDVVSAGGGGPDFRIDDAQLRWIDGELQQADAAAQSTAIFMHAYPADLRAGADRLRALIARHRVACVDMGHTHYNELANDGRTIYMATRSTGQIEEGPVGFSVTALDSGVVSWRFVPLEDNRPIVLITRPSDHRLIREPGAPHQLVRATLAVRAKVWSAVAIRDVHARIDGGEPVVLTADPLDPSLWAANIAAEAMPDGLHDVTVRAHDVAGRAGAETIAVLASQVGRYDAPSRIDDGSDRDAIGAWPEKGLLGTRLGPNRNGRKW